MRFELQKLRMGKTFMEIKREGNKRIYSITYVKQKLAIEWKYKWKTV